MNENLIAGAWDVHVHAAPSLFPRWGDGVDLAQACLAAGMGGFVLKAHGGSTVSSAAVLDRVYPKLRIFGGVVLNRFVGGLNPDAVELSLELGGRIVWMPTIHADNHRVVFGHLGGFPHAAGATSRREPECGLRVVDENGDLLPAVAEIVRMLDHRSAALGTGHLSFDEILALHSHIQKERLQVRLLINHVFFSTLRADTARLRALQGPNTFFETCYFTSSPLSAAASPTEIAETILALPDARWILASDSGQRDNPAAPDALNTQIEKLADAGIPKSLLARMLHDNPEELLAS